MNISRRQFLAGLAAASTTTYFDMGKNLWRQKPLEIVGFSSHAMNEQKLIEIMAERFIEAELNLIKRMQESGYPIR